jgi:hypothetical protein
MEIKIHLFGSIRKQVVPIPEADISFPRNILKRFLVMGMIDAAWASSDRDKSRPSGVI